MHIFKHLDFNIYILLYFTYFALFIPLYSIIYFEYQNFMELST